MVSVGSDREARLRARRNSTITSPREVTYRTAAVPLGITAPRRRAENDDLEFRRGPLVERHLSRLLQISANS